uniref:Portal protein n=2 Tax=viral metagenome TaxID=1070528 RepID=A0A6M3J533_9ZZZZ
MPLLSAAEEIKKFETQQKFTQDLRDRMDEEYALYRGDEDVYNIPVEEGDWENVITNRAKVEVNRVIEDLSYAARKLYIPVSEEDKRDRRALSRTEQAAIGIIYLGDMLLQGSPFSSDLQSLLAKYWVLRGISVKRFLLREEEDKLVPDIAVWDGRNAQWIEGKKKLIWVGNIRYASPEQVKDEYEGWNGGVDDAARNLVKIYDIWDCSTPGKPAQEGVIIGTEYVKEPKDVKVGDSTLDYIPINIATRRGMPLISDSNTDNIKFTAQSYLTNNKELYTIESKLLTYVLTGASRDTKTPIVIEWNGQGNSPIEKFRDTDPFVQGRVIVLDTSKGEKLAGELPPSNTGNILQMYDMLLGLLGIGGMSPVAFGRISQALPAQGIDILSHAALANERAFKDGMEGDYVWLAGEAIRQYKLGNFKEQEFEGYDKGNSPFRVKVKPNDIDENWHFKCELIPDLIRDKAGMINIASQAVRDKLLSRQTARDQFQLVLDTDLEEAKVGKEDARSLFGIGEIEAFMAYVDDYAKVLKIKVSDAEKAKFIIDHAYPKLLRAIGNQPQGGEGGGGNGSMPARQVVNNNQMTARTAQPSIPPEVVKAAQMKNLGL